MTREQPKLPPMYRYSVILENGHGISIITDRKIDLLIDTEWLVASMDDLQESWMDGNFRKVWIRRKKIFAIMQQKKRTHRYRSEEWLKTDDEKQNI